MIVYVGLIIFVDILSSLSLQFDHIRLYNAIYGFYCMRVVFQVFFIF